MPTFLTVKTAATQFRKSPSSIRRILYRIIANDKHPDRTHVEPSAEEVRKLRANGDNFAWRISEELLRRELPGESDAKKTTATAPPASADSELFAMLRRELDIKNQQIADYTEHIRSLNERLREGNLLFGALQQRLALPDGRRVNHEGPVEVKPSTPAEKGSKVAAKPAPKPKKGLFRRLFG